MVSKKLFQFRKALMSVGLISMILFQACGLIIDSARCKDRFSQYAVKGYLRPGISSSQIRSMIGDPSDLRITRWPDGRTVEIWEYKKYKPDTEGHIILGLTTIGIWSLLPLPLPKKEVIPPHRIVLVNDKALAFDTTSEMLPPSESSVNKCSFDFSRITGYGWICGDNTGNTWEFILRGDGTGWGSLIGDFYWKQFGCDVRVEGMPNQTWTDFTFYKEGISAKISFDVGVTKWVFCVPKM